MNLNRTYDECDVSLKPVLLLALRYGLDEYVISMKQD